MSSPTPSRPRAPPAGGGIGSGSGSGVAARDARDANDANDANRASEEPSSQSALRLPLPAFESVRRSSRSPSQRPGSRSSGSHSGQSRGSETAHGHLLDRLSPAASSSSKRSDRDSGSNDKGKHKEEASRRHRPRSSGGFLLEPVASQRGWSRDSTVPSRQSSTSKRRSEHSDLAVPKRRQRPHSGVGTSSFRSSPLASEIKNDPAVPPHRPRTTGLGFEAHSSPTSSQHVVWSNDGASSQRPSVDRPPQAKVGFDQDPAQVVNMALSLSEGRRRLASGRRYVSTDLGEKRVLSAASATNPRGTVNRRSIAPFMSSSPQTSRTGSPKRSLSTTPGPGSGLSPGLAATVDGPGPDGDGVDAATFDADFVDLVSPATMARVAKAKAYFELAHHHRRLLPHLPPIRRPGTPSLTPGPEAFQKAYNPLQYVRNRKLRIWEKNTIDSEAEGWHDVEKVKVWVDAVLASHPTTSHDCDECVRLPPLGLKPAENSDDDQEPRPQGANKPMSPRVADQFHTKPIRPRSDWVTHPSDLIADAYWLEQGMNKTKIQDRDNNLIYTPNTHFKFSGWRNRASNALLPTLQQPSPPPDPEPHISDEPPPSAMPDLPTFKSAHHTHGGSRSGRKRDKLRDSLQVMDHSSSRERSRVRRKLFQDSSESDFSGSQGSSSDGKTPERGRMRRRRKKLKEQHHHGALSSTSNQLPGGHNKQSPHGDSSQNSTAPNSKRSSADPAALNRLLVRDTHKKSPFDRIRSESKLGLRKGHGRSSMENERPPRQSAEYDSVTAPNSPSVVEWPSIAINLSPPPSRPTSPARKPKSTLLHSLHRRHHKNNESISATDFAQNQPAQSAMQPGSDGDKNHSDGLGSRGTSPHTRSHGLLAKDPTQGPQEDELATHASHASHASHDHRLSTISRVSTRSNAPGDHGRIRGMFKGGRIAELVGHEVSRVGEYIWKRDGPGSHRYRESASDTSLHSGPDTDYEKEGHENGAPLKTPPPPGLRNRSSTLESTKSDRSATMTTPPSNERPRYNNPNLPTFTSPFQRDKEQQEARKKLLTPTSNATLSSDDHIARLAAERRSASRSPRLGFLPRLDTSAASSAKNDMVRKQSYGFGAALDMSRSREATVNLNSAIGPVLHTGLADLQATRSGDSLKKAGADEAIEAAGKVTWRDIGRAEALLYSSVVKAREIGRRAETPGPNIPRYLLESLSAEDRAQHEQQPLQVKRREEHVVAARNIMKTLDGHVSKMNSQLEAFSSTTVPNLHTQLQSLEDGVENSTTPGVRRTADEAGELSMKLNSTSTLAIKALNDVIEAAMRRRRRGPVRWVRRLWYQMVEWGVVSTLWGIWFVVTLIKMLLAVFGGALVSVRWLLWID